MAGELTIWTDWLFGLSEDVVSHAVIVVTGAVGLLWAFRKPQGVVGEPPPEGLEDRSHGEFEQTAARFKGLLLGTAVWAGAFVALELLPSDVQLQALALQLAAGLAWFGVHSLKKELPEASDWYEEGHIKAQAHVSLVLSVVVLALTALFAFT